MGDSASLRSPARQTVDPWRRRMTRLAASLRELDEQRFSGPIARIEELLRVDANWNLDAALASYARSHNLPSGAQSPRPGRP
jgi:hypothetical protein